MTFSRRSFLGGGAAALLGADMAQAVPSADQEFLSAPQSIDAVPLEVLALNRMAYGPRPGDVQRVKTMGLTAYVDEQLNPNPNTDTDCNNRIASALLRINYTAGNGYPALDEMRPLETLEQPLSDLWTRSKHLAFAERVRPVDEMRAATWLRAIYSKWQLLEVMVEFWVNHFNVQARSSARISATWPYVMRQVFRAHALGNFRELCEEVAKSIAMQYYLNNSTSRDGPANENYARELFELHTLGADNYFNHLYDQWDQVPGANTKNPIGYIDADVYEAARAFTGWTIADGKSIGSNIFLPDTGEFTYVEIWHDSAQKRVLARDFNNNAPPMDDGKRVLDILAAHPGTARYVCTKICRRLVADAPPTSLIDKAVQTWLTNVSDPDQIKKVLRTILLSPEFAASSNKKVKRPFEHFASFFRATAAEVTPNSNLFSRLALTGYMHYDWPTPTGMPDVSNYWLTTNGMLQRWNALYYFMQPSQAIATFNLQSQIPGGVTTCRQIVDYWVDRIYGYAVDGATHTEFLNFMRQGGNADAAPTGTASDVTARIDNLVMLMAMVPAYQWR